MLASDNNVYLVDVKRSTGCDMKWRLLREVFPRLGRGTTQPRSLEMKFDL